MARSHTKLAKFIHWSFVLLYTYGIIKQVDDLSSLGNARLLLFEVGFATLFLVIVLARYFYMRRFETLQGSTVPVHVIHKRFARLVHVSMYICLILLPVTGLLIAGLYSQGYTVNATPDEPQTVMDFALDLHGLAADLSYFLIFLHISAAIYSRFKGEGVWSSMVPILNSETPRQGKVVTKLTDIENRFYDRVGKYFSKKQ
ncbi:MAG: cytochrome b/b6 domain-containing protein [Candidatus Thermoplasmatota archaeon]|nr:cytochrome b/b6 domain-containing protein [Candidatus Thermoplasmatota archaeon]|tara:strand:+ start:387 stop:989 length:603 start_codon:yes stop_codon:yes gene_type:complete